MPQTVFTTTGIMHDGRELLNAHVKELERVYTPRGYEHKMSATIEGSTFEFTLSERERNDPSAWLQRELGPLVRFQDSNRYAVLEAIQTMSEPGFVLKPSGGIQQDESGVWRDGKRLTDFGIKAVKKVQTTAPAEVSVPGVQQIGIENRYFDVETIRGGISKITRLTRSDLNSGMAAHKISGNITDNVAFAMLIQSLADEVAA